MDIVKEIKRLKKDKRAVILAHNYQDVSIMQVADYIGDSLQLSMQARDAAADIIVFCGVRFMAETAAVLNPRAKVLLPVEDAGCPMADMINANQLRLLKSQHPGAVVFCYVNSTLEVKAESDICCTSSNAVKVVQSIPAEKPIIFVPDKNLGAWVAQQSGRDIIIHNGYCIVHQFGFNLDDVNQARRDFPDHTLIVHPECAQEIVNRADAVMSTSGMVEYARHNDKIIFGTEVGLIDYLKNQYPDKSLQPLSHRAICQNMKKTRLENVWQALLSEQHMIVPDAEISAKALKCIERMLAL